MYYLTRNPLELPQAGLIVIAVGLLMNTIPMENLLMPKEALLIGVIGGGFSLILIKFVNRNAT